MVVTRQGAATHPTFTRFILYCPHTRPPCQDGNEKAKWDTLACRWEPRDDEDEDEDEAPSVSPGFRGNSTSPPNIEAPEVSAGPRHRLRRQRRAARTSRATRLLHFLGLLNSKNQTDHETVAFFEASRQQKRAGPRDCCILLGF